MTDNSLHPATNVVPTEWLAHVDAERLGLTQTLANGYYHLQLDEELEIRFTAASADSRPINIKETTTQSFSTDFGLLLVENAFAFFEMLSGFPFSKNGPFSIEKWFRFSLLKSPKTFSSLWHTIAPCEKPTECELFPVQISLLQQETGVTATFWLDIQDWKAMLSQSSLDYTSRPSASVSQPYCTDFNLFQLDLAETEFNALEAGDLLLPQHFFVDEGGLGVMELFGKVIEVQLIADDKDFSLKVINTRDADSHLPNIEKTRYAGFVTNQVRNLEQ